MSDPKCTKLSEQAEVCEYDGGIVIDIENAGESVESVALTRHEAAMLCCWLMRHLPVSAFDDVPAGEFITGTGKVEDFLTAEVQYHYPPWTDGVTVVDTNSLKTATEPE